LSTQSSIQLSRRDFIKLAGGATLAVAGASLLPQYLRKVCFGGSCPGANHRAGSVMGWHGRLDPPAAHPGDPDPYFPDDCPGYPDGSTPTSSASAISPALTEAQITAQKNHGQHNARCSGLDEVDPTQTSQGFQASLTTWGWLNARTWSTRTPCTGTVPQRDPLLRWRADRLCLGAGWAQLHYVYRPRNPGTYMYHATSRDVEHVHMGRPAWSLFRAFQNFTGPGRRSCCQVGRQSRSTAPMGLCLRRRQCSTAYDASLPFLSEVWAEAALVRLAHPTAHLERLPRRLQPC